MRYQLKGLESTSLFRIVFFSLWIVMGGIGLIAYIAYLTGSIEFGFVEDEFLAALFGGLLGPPLLSLILAVFSVLGNLIYKRLLRSLPPVIVEVGEVDEPVPSEGGSLANDPVRKP